MKEIIISTQAEWDALPAKFDSEVAIKITGQLREIKATPGNATVSVSGSARVGYVSGSARVDSVSDSARVDSVYDSARVDSVYGSARVGYVSGSARVDSVSGSARVDSVSDSARVGSVYGSASVGSVYGTATVYIHNNSALVLAGFAVAFLYAKAKVKKAKTATIIRPRWAKGATGWSEREGVISAGRGKVILFKRVSQKFQTQEGTKNETIWTPGATLTVPNWNPTSSECGEGKFHGCARPGPCSQFRNLSTDRFVAIEVELKDLHAWEGGDYPHKIAFRSGKVLYECDIFGEKVTA